MASELDDLSRRSVQLLSLLAFRRLQQACFLPRRLAGDFPETRLLALALAQSFRRPLPDRPPACEHSGRNSLTACAGDESFRPSLRVAYAQESTDYRHHRTGWFLSCRIAF